MDKAGLKKQWNEVNRHLEAAIIPPRRWHDDLYFKTKTSHIGLRNVHIPESWSDRPSAAALGKVADIVTGAVANQREPNYRREIHKFKLDLDEDNLLGSPTIGWVVAACKTIKTSMKKEFLENITTS